MDHAARNAVFSFQNDVSQWKTHVQERLGRFAAQSGSYGGHNSSQIVPLSVSVDANLGL